ncbi:Mediator of RNA polymerase II transcription subunit 22 [Balamuthia mandrillaris]
MKRTATNAPTTTPARTSMPSSGSTSSAGGGGGGVAAASSGASSSAAASAVSVTSNVALQRLLDSFHSRIDEKTEKLTEHFGNLLKASKVSENMQSASEDFLIEVQSTNLISAGEALLSLVAELKQGVLLNDFASRNAEVAQLQQQYRGEEERARQSIQQLSMEVNAALFELENHYHSSFLK